MTTTLARLRQGTRALEARLTAAFERTAKGSNTQAPLEVLARAVEELPRHVQPSGRGRYRFPFNHVELFVVAPTPDDQARFEVLCAGPPSLRQRLEDRLASEGCEDVALDVAVRYVPIAESNWTSQAFYLSLGREERLPAAARAELRIDALVTHGQADRGAYSFKALPIAIGRGAEVRDARMQLMRVNHIAFAEGDDDVNRSVSRRHARIELDAATGRPRLIDDNSAQGTSIIRAGRGLPVPRGSRGLALQSDDEIVLGQARLRVRLSESR